VTCDVCGGEYPPHLHAGADNRPVEDYTGRFLDGKKPAYVSEAADRLARRTAELEELAKRPPVPRPLKFPRPPRPHLSDDERRILGLAPRRA